MCTSHLCPFEFLHFAPIFLIVASLFMFAKNIKNPASPLVVLVLSVVGLMAGSHMHTAHAEAFTLLDPCVGYLVSAVVSVAHVVRSFAKA